MKAVVIATLALLSSLSAMAAETDQQALVKQGEYLARAGDCGACHTAKGDDQGYGDQVLSADPGRHVLQIHLGILLALFRDTISQKVIDFGRGPMAVGQGTQVLVTCLEQRPLGIEDIEKTEFAQLKALGCVVVGQLRPGQHLAPQGFEFKPAIAQPLTGL